MANGPKICTGEWPGLYYIILYHIISYYIIVYNARASGPGLEPAGRAGCRRRLPQSERERESLERERGREIRKGGREGLEREGGRERPILFSVSAQKMQTQKNASPPLQLRTCARAPMCVFELSV